MVGLMVTSSRRSYAIGCVSQVCCSQSPCPCSRLLLTHASAGDTQTLRGRSGSVSVGSLGPGAHRFFFEPSEQGLRQKMSAILDTFGSNQFMLNPWTMLFLEKLCPGPFPSVTE